MRIAADQIAADRLSYARSRVRSVSGACVWISRGMARPHVKDRTKSACRRGRFDPGQRRCRFDAPMRLRAERDS
ncbi:carboxymuconolactone decarboxylase [Burkholderia pseudomallei]|uniref:carboxymuconolactone decarboxylase n=1 Tax=Burkholderia pseudomallei TaxID=28450 RepID=UPI00039EA4D7|nr:carboxymuconolactone decarboxylase [Burkholderia pseudomallei]MBD2914689.1 carboxymuconolactone decarboxylase [Burkholderia pseudomallei]MBD2927263.1 carboxymuconolactone decarboxylase [Burkholderia pseudomallei]MBD2933150.1 carboxymuconolactone decarboxylase [Burkholderia pseudomallei]MBD2967228.1 carboxymuconolactone decarboxylase [Burkholderia pseudomallei]MDV2104825.1 carboxymuconolactone decarboxylase [Burkholderia pseudomallei]